MSGEQLTADSLPYPWRQIDSKQMLHLKAKNTITGVQSLVRSGGSLVFLSLFALDDVHLAIKPLPDQTETGELNR